jgi:Kef-type K+ transport system membrane component KefB
VLDALRLLLTALTVLGVARLFGALSQRLGQPRVIGEMFAGIALGPSLLGVLSPEAAAILLPAESAVMLNVLSQAGVLLFLFAVGWHLELSELTRQGRSAVIISQVGIAAPLLLGATLAVWLHPRFAPAGVSMAPFALFLGVAMSITAFPVLARILEERQLLGTSLGTLALACAAIGDATAWVLLGMVMTIIGAGSIGWPFAISVAGALLFLAVMWRLVRPFLSRLRPNFAVLLGIALCSAWITHALGIHALFGAFVAGVVAPRQDVSVASDTSPAQRAKPLLAKPLLDRAVDLLLPFFFVATGLRTRLVLERGFTEVLPMVAILLVAIGGKVGGTAIAARLRGEAWGQAAALGVLMNTRGLMELVVLNVGLDLGVLSPPLFTMMVVMALATTVMTVPMLRLLGPSRMR